MPPPRVLTSDEVALRVTNWRPLPPVLYELLDLREADPTAIAHLGTIVDADPDLDRRMRFLGGKSPVLEGNARSRVHAAIQQIGYRRVHCGAVAVVVVDAMAANAHSFDFLEYWGSAAGCAALTASIAEMERSPARDLAYTAGLLQNAGLWAVDMVVPDLLAELCAAVDGEGWSESLEEAILGFTLNDVTSALHRRWHLPLELAEALLVHNQPALWATRPLARALWQARDGLGAAGIADPLRGISPHATASPTARTVLDRYYGGGAALLEGAQRLVSACLLARESLEAASSEPKVEASDGAE